MKIDSELMDRARRMVEKGADLLNKSKPANKRNPWHAMIREKDLKQSSGFHCLLAHVFGDYWRGLNALGLSTMNANTSYELTDSDIERFAQYGFALGKEYMSWEALEAAWIEKISSIRSPVRVIL